MYLIKFFKKLTNNNGEFGKNYPGLKETKEYQKQLDDYRSFLDAVAYRFIPETLRAKSKLNTKISQDKNYIEISVQHNFKNYVNEVRDYLVNRFQIPAKSILTNNHAVLNVYTLSFPIEELYKNIPDLSHPKLLLDKVTEYGIRL